MKLLYTPNLLCTNDVMLHVPFPYIHVLIQRYGGSDEPDVYIDKKLVEVIGIEEVTKQQRLVHS